MRKSRKNKFHPRYSPLSLSPPRDTNLSLSLELDLFLLKTWKIIISSSSSSRMVHEAEECKNKHMCTNHNSNTSSGSNCGGGGSGGGCGCTKKIKAQKVPQRGPGVAELEKILREQQNKTDEKSVIEIEGYPSSVFPLSHPFSFLCPPPPPPPPPPEPISNMVLSRNSNFPIMKRPFYESNLNGEVPKKSDLGTSNLVQLNHESDTIRGRNFYNYPHSMMMNHNYPSSSAIPASTVSPSGLNHHHIILEHPSNQSSQNNFTSMWPMPEQEKMVGMKRTWPFSMDYTASPSTFHYKAPPFSSHMNRTPDQSSSYSNQFTSTSEPQDTISRDAMRRFQYELSPKNKCINQNGAIDGNILTLGPPKASLPPSMQTTKDDYSNHNFSLQNGSVEDRYQRSEGQGGGGGSSNEMPFYSFLQPKGYLGTDETSLRLDNGKDEEGQSLDLTLKL